MGTFLRIPGVKLLIKDFAKAVHKHKGYVILVNDMNVVTKEWNRIIDYQIKGTCNEWVKLVGIELSNIKRSKKRKKNEIDIKKKDTNNKLRDKIKKKYISDLVIYFSLQFLIIYRSMHNTLSQQCLNCKIY
ncbi:hypothetical protein C2G38_2228138 [Gigaspora rosea]|uniref:Uncharacterized protein n=1 Tax=Gigaspora rosea TaxID=44941 RepID=A0A397TZG1_9GLOM|nr:hypothetical protein C2G38_2228138 [Gigaspora rosea]